MAYVGKAGLGAADAAAAAAHAASADELGQRAATLLCAIGVFSGHFVLCRFGDAPFGEASFGNANFLLLAS